MCESGPREGRAMSDATPRNTDADRRRRSASSELDQGRRGDLGQFLTPSDVAHLMAKMFGRLPADIHLLEAGAGAGGLIAAFTDEVASRRSRPRSLRVSAFEIDPVLLPHLAATVDQCRSRCAAAGILFDGEIRHCDYIESAVTDLERGLLSGPPPTYNVSILNPPYRKIATSSIERRLLQRAGLDATNLYAAFVALAIRQLAPNGQMVAIIPRSFCNGPYFRPFRDVLLDEARLSRIHLFDSRSEAFRDDGVLQENVIVHIVKDGKHARPITVSRSANAADAPCSRVVPYEDVVRGANGDRFIHVPGDDEDDRVAAWVGRLPATLDDLGVRVSTGRVVDFRARNWLRAEPSDRTAPLIYPCHFDGGVITWPKIPSRKPNAIVANRDSRALLVPAGYYVFTKRFSSKEERRRIVAAVFDPKRTVAESIGIENHINYFHCEGNGIDRHFAYGLAAFLNSTPVDRYFRQFNGHTQVNATDLRALRYPSRATLLLLGRRFARKSQLAQNAIDEIVLHDLPL